MLPEKHIKNTSLTFTYSHTKLCAPITVNCHGPTQIVHHSKYELVHRLYWGLRCNRI
jgi:hypothetical protein